MGFVLRLLPLPNTPLDKVREDFHLPLRNEQYEPYVCQDAAECMQKTEQRANEHED